VRHPARRQRTRRTLLAGFAVALLLSACGTGDEQPAAAPDDPAGSSGGDLAIAVASFDLAVGDDQRLLAGLLSQERELLAFGEVTFQLAHLGDEAGGEAELTQSVTADFLPVPGAEPEDATDAPRFLSGEPGSGVYAGRVDLDQPGFWGLRVIAETEDGRTIEGNTTFAVQDERQVIGAGDPAPRTQNPTIEDAEAGTIEPEAIDSRAGTADGEIPDAHLHDTVIADALDEGRPVVVAVTTPVYCASRFCGPQTNVMAELARTHADTAAFVHLEVWRDFDEQVINEAAAEWILSGPEAQGNEPWVFLVDADGTITHRWDNVLDLDEFEAALAAL
jgi:hypothetical protein